MVPSSGGRSFIAGDASQPPGERAEFGNSARWTDALTSCGVDELDSVPRALPALLQAAKLARRADRAGRIARKAEPRADTEDEAVGDELFALARRATSRGIEPEAALREACERFRARHAVG